MWLTVAGTSKHYGDPQLTSLGYEQNFQVGSYYRTRYLDGDSPHRIRGISEFEYVPKQVYASAPDSPILLGTATAFLQGLYPPLEDTNPDLGTTELNNGSDSSNPLGKYQYVPLHGMNEDAPDAIWIKGDNGCPAASKPQETFEKSDVFKERVDGTKSFYQSFESVLSEVYDLKAEDLSYKNAYDIFDLINVARIHNESSPAVDVSDDDFHQLRTLADSSEFGRNFDPDHPDHSIGARTLIAGVMSQLNETVATEAALKFSLFAGSYDTILGFFGVTGLWKLSDDFQGLPEYASTLAFELFTDGDGDEFPSNTDDLRVRFLFMNGTSGDLNPFPLFGAEDDTYSWPDFEDKMRGLEIATVGGWCGICESELSFCAAYTDASTKGIREGMSAEMKGGIAMIVIGGVAFVAAVLFFVSGMRRRNSAKTAVAGASAGAAEKGSLHSWSSDSRV